MSLFDALSSGTYALQVVEGKLVMSESSPRNHSVTFTKTLTERCLEVRFHCESKGALTLRINHKVGDNKNRYRPIIFGIPHKILYRPPTVIQMDAPATGYDNPKISDERPLDPEGTLSVDMTVNEAKWAKVDELLISIIKDFDTKRITNAANYYHFMNVHTVDMTPKRVEHDNPSTSYCCIS